MALNFQEVEKTVQEQYQNIADMTQEQLINYLSAVSVLSAVYDNHKKKIDVVVETVLQKLEQMIENAI